MNLRFALTLALSLISAPALAFVVPSAPTLDNRSSILIDFASGQVLTDNNPHMPVEPASLTKMMTSYIVERALESGRLKETDLVGVSEHAWCRGSSNESCMFLPLNGQATVIDMLRGVIIQSGNDASKALAEHMAGSEPAFAEIMNAEAKRLGMKDTQFKNATGLPSPGHITTAYDMAILARAIIKDSNKYYPIYAEKSFTYNNIKQGNRNALLYTDPTVDGLKTGHTNAAGYCLVASSERRNMRLIAAVMGTNSMQARADQVRALLNWGFSSYENVTPMKAGTELANAPVWFGVNDTISVGLANDLSLTIPRGKKDDVEAKTRLQPELEAPIAKGQVVGEVVVSIGDKVLSTQPLVALTDVEEANVVVRLWHYLKRFLSQLF
ncbi:penicillin-binding protein 6 [Paraperlucidibaca baekdonensis]|uniref:serine-type D-Ala-D-Ala carboxypeptidase n=1 Tax=Paraperlucidibaca baekdonensis TaxID=748120 RepID=A0A3E0HB56_9GAMM|nr:D-alanyl-D-alanine carboxypeptidase family protein [Paraperlucidibaca baekdonensis]REH40462.1 penicillin-binding protein 6 [Paraperlucidibaca baekdonensis]